MSLFEKMSSELLEKTTVMTRFMNNQALWEKFALKFVDDQTYEKLAEAITRRDKTKAFEEAHTLKGVVGNMGFMTLFSACIGLVEELREDGSWDDIIPHWQGVQEEYHKITEEIQKNRD